MALNTNKIVFKTDEEIKEQAKSIVEGALDFECSVHMGLPCTCPHLPPAVRVIKLNVDRLGKEKVIENQANLIINTAEYDLNVSSRSLSPTAQKSHNANQVKTFTVNFYHNTGFTIYPDTVIQKLNDAFSDDATNSGPFGSRKQLDTKIAFVKGSVTTLSGANVHAYICTSPDTGTGSPVGDVHSDVGLVEKDINFIYADFGSSCSFGAYATSASVAFPYGASIVWPEYESLSTYGTIVHEMGHVFDLAHPFGGNCGAGNESACNCQDDGVSDTPLTKINDSTTRTNECGDGDSMNENWMDYAYFYYSFSDCFFTQGQNSRMQAAINTNMSDWYSASGGGAGSGGGGGSGAGGFDLPSATLIGYSSKGNFFGEDVARWRTVQTVTIEGVMGPTDIENMAADDLNIDDPDSWLYLDLPVSVNGIAVNNSRLISLSFPASAAATENHDGTAKFIATYEVYIVPASSTILGIAFNDLKSLEDFSENISFNLEEDNSYSCSHTLNVKYASGTGGGADGNAGESTDGIAAAKTLAATIFAGTPPSIPSSIQGHPGSYGRAGKRYYTESYDLEGFGCSFTESYKLYSTQPAANATNYTAKIKISVSYTEEGMVNVTEDAEIKGLDTAAGLFSSAKTGANTEFALSYNRCNGYYQYWKGMSGFTGWGPVNLQTQASEINESYDEEAGTATYSAIYTNDSTYDVTNGFLFESTITKSKDPGKLTTINENATITVMTESKSEDDSSASAAWQSLYSDDALVDFIHDKMDTSADRFDVLDNPNENYVSQTWSIVEDEIKIGKKTSSFSIKWSNDEAIKPLAGINKLERSMVTNPGFLKKEWFNPPNNPVGGEFPHFGQAMVDVSTRKVEYRGILSRNTTWPGKGNYPVWKYASVLKQTLNTLKPHLKLDALRGFLDYYLPVEKIYQDKYYFSDVSWNFSSDYSFDISLEMKFVVPVGTHPGWPTLHADNTIIST